MKACPAGWHLPDNAEWENLLRAVGGREIAAGKLKSKTGWENVDGGSGNGVDEYGFSALPGGNRHPTCGYLSHGSGGYWWSASNYKIRNVQHIACYWCISKYGGVNMESSSVFYGYSVMCVKN